MQDYFNWALWNSQWSPQSRHMLCRLPWWPYVLHRRLSGWLPFFVDMPLDHLYVHVWIRHTNDKLWIDVVFHCPKQKLIWRAFHVEIIFFVSYKKLMGENFVDLIPYFQLLVNYCKHFFVDKYRQKTTPLVVSKTAIMLLGNRI